MVCLSVYVHCCILFLSCYFTSSLIQHFFVLQCVSFVFNSVGFVLACVDGMVRRVGFVLLSVVVFTVAPTGKLICTKALTWTFLFMQ